MHTTRFNAVAAQFNATWNIFNITYCAFMPALEYMDWIERATGNGHHIPFVRPAHAWT